MSRPDKAKSLFSEKQTLTTAQRHIALALRARQCQHFRSNVFSENPDDENSPRIWLEAEQAQDGLQWTLIEYKTVPDGKTMAVAERRNTLHENISFFDALYATGEFEIAMTEHDLMACALTRSPQNDIAHYQDSAKNEGIPCDTSGLPLLAANGRLQMDGTYSPDARIIARNAGPVETKESPASAAASSAFLAAALPPARKDSTALVRTYDADMLSLVRDSEELCYQIERVERALKYCYKSEFKRYGPQAGILPLITIPVLGQVFAATTIAEYGMDGIREELPRRFFKQTTGKLEKLGKKFNDKAAQAMLDQYCKDTRLTYHGLHIRFASRQYLQHKVRAGYRDRTLAAFEKEAAKQGLPKEHIAEYQQRFQENLTNESQDEKIIEGFEKASNKMRTFLRHRYIP